MANSQQGKQNHRFQRWQKYAIDQLTFTLNLFWAISTASFAFSINLVRDKEFILFGFSKCIFLISLASLFLAMLLNSGAVVSRLFDFRFTVKKIKADGEFDYEASGIYKHKNKLLGKLTWRLFWSQMAFLVIGLIALLTSFISFYWSKLL